MKYFDKNEIVKKSLTVLLIGLGFQSTSFAKFQDSGVSTVSVYKKKGNTIVETDLTNYQMIFLNDNYSLPYVLKSKMKSTQNLAGEGSRDSAELSFFSLKESGSKITNTSTPLWKKTVEKAGLVKELWNLISTTEYGCCGMEDIVTLHSPTDGKTVLSYYDSRIYRIQILGQRLILPRFVASTPERKSSIESKEYQNIATLEYVDSSGKKLDKIHLFLKDFHDFVSDLSEFKAVKNDSPKVNIRESNVELSSNSNNPSEDDIHGFSFTGSLTTNSGVNITFSIPIEGNNFDLEKAVIGEGIKIERSNMK